MQDDYERVYADPAFQAVQQRRSRLCWLLAAVVFFSFYTFIAVIAFFPQYLAVPLYEGTVITWGVPVGVAIIVLGIALTGYYVWRANSEFDVEIEAIVARLTDPGSARGPTD